MVLLNTGSRFCLVTFLIAGYITIKWVLNAGAVHELLDTLRQHVISPRRPTDAGSSRMIDWSMER